MSKLATHQDAVMSLAVDLDLEAPEAGSRDAEGLSEPLRQVYREHFSRVWRSLRRLGVHEAQLEDAVQDVFIVVDRRWAGFERRSSLKTWIYGITVRVAKDYRRSHDRHVRRVQGLAELGNVEPAPAPDEAAERAEARRVIQAVLATLRDEQREVLVLVELEQLSVREASAALGLHVRACQRRLRAAHQALEAALAARFASPGSHRS
jgi:RNA polymerase sigma-70 factor (ECF subfamily)